MSYLSNILAMPVIDFENYKEDFTWDSFFHTPVVTPKFISNKLGVDFIAFAGSEQQATRQLNTIAKVAKDYLFGRLPKNSLDYEEYRLSRDIGLLYDYLAYQCSFVIAATMSGSIYELYNINKGDDRPYISGIVSAAASVSVKFRASMWDKIPRSLYRVGY